MPTWAELFDELREMTVPRVDAYDYVRRRSLSDLSNYTGRDTVVYAAAHLQRPDAPSFTSINNSDLTGFMEVAGELPGPDLDLIIHSAGGSIEATESIGEYLRESFESVRVFVPHMAMSAATLLALIGDEIHMGSHSQLGPIDPQFILQTAFGIRSVPAQAILEQFQNAREACINNPDEIPVWAEMLQQYGPGLLVESRNASALSLSVATSWLERYMLSTLPDGVREQYSEEVARYLSDHSAHLTHARGIFALELQSLDRNLAIVNLESNPELHERVLTVYYSLMHTFSNTLTAKLIENHSGNSYVIVAANDG